VVLRIGTVDLRPGWQGETVRPREVLDCERFVCQSKGVKGCRIFVSSSFGMSWRSEVGSPTLPCCRSAACFALPFWGGSHLSPFTNSSPKALAFPALPTTPSAV
jgi:hypothetical protein